MKRLIHCTMLVLLLVGASGCRKPETVQAEQPKAVDVDALVAKYTAIAEADAEKLLGAEIDVEIVIRDEPVHTLAETIGRPIDPMAKAAFTYDGRVYVSREGFKDMAAKSVPPAHVLMHCLLVHEFVHVYQEKLLDSRLYELIRQHEDPIVQNGFIALCEGHAWEASRRVAWNKYKWRIHVIGLDMDNPQHSAIIIGHIMMSRVGVSDEAFKAMLTAESSEVVDEMTGLDADKLAVAMMEYPKSLKGFGR